MTSRASTRSLVLAILIGAGFGAAQMGLGYGLGIVAWVTPGAPRGAVTDEGVWVSSLAWATWTAATSVIAGAICADRLNVPVESGRWARIGWRAVTAFAAAIGALITVPLVAVPARAAQLSTNFAPHLLAGAYAVTGVVIGLVASLAALASRAIAANVIVSACWLWLLGAVAVTDGVTTGRGLTVAQLGVWRFTTNGPTWRSFYLPGALLMLFAALLIGGLAAWPGARRGDNRVGVAISGAIGPLLVAGAYFLATPAFGTAPDAQVSAYLTAPYAVIAGLAGSILVAAVVALDHRSGSDSIVDDGLVAPGLGANRSAEPDPIRPARRSSLPSVYEGLLPSQPATGKASVPPASRIGP
jgi:hypothetical protein